jgi:hypothetical protein
MFVVTIVYLATVGVAVHLVVEEFRHDVMAASQRSAQAAAEPEPEEDLFFLETGRFAPLIATCGMILIGLTGVYFLEFLLHRVTGGNWTWHHLAACLFPPLRLGTRDHGEGRLVWLPGLGWQPASDDVAEQVEVKLGYPMIGIALLILPLLAVEFIFVQQIQEYAWLALVTQLAGAFIWLAFAIEYLVMISLVSNRIKFVKEQWLNLAIILLPLIAFLRVLRIGRLVKLGKLTRTARLFRLRGLVMRAWRALLILEIVDRLLHRDPHKRLDLLKSQLEEKQQEIEALREEIAQLEAELAPKEA